MSHKQLLCVKTPSWDSVQGEMQLWELKDSWKPIYTPISVVIGQAGMAWGIGLHPQMQGLAKREGDLKTPAGIFALGTAFGRGQGHFKINYLQLKASTEAVDDPKSRYYNQIVDSEITQPDWNSSEKMSEIQVYELGINVHHNFPKPVPDAGSAIFIHLWTDQNSGTAGCTAMSRENLLRILNWLDPAKEPRIVQLPVDEYRKLRTPWNLP